MATAAAASTSASAAATTAASSDPRGPPLARYRVFWNQPAQPSRRVLLLQYPQRSRRRAFGTAAAGAGGVRSALRLKPAAGLVEVDVPVDPYDGEYDAERALRFGRALQASRTRQAGGEFGAAGGFGGVAGGGVAAAAGGGRRGPDGMEVDDLVDFELGPEDLEEALEKGLAMNKITFGGRVMKAKAGDPVYAIGVFKGDELHLTKVDAICQLQPQFHHIDAIAENERTSRSAGDHGAGESEARAVNMAVKSADAVDLDMSEVGKTLRVMQEEPWQHLEWIEEGDDRAYFSYNSNLVLSNTDSCEHLLSAMTEKQYLDAISAPRIDPTKQGKKVMMSRPWSSDSEDELVEDSEGDAEEGGGRK